MKRISLRQREEIYFLSKKMRKIEPTPQEIDEYFDWVSMGKEPSGDNRLVQARRGFDITLKMWRKDMMGRVSGIPILFAFELLEDEELKCPYLERVVYSTIDGLPKFYKNLQLECIKQR